MISRFFRPAAGGTESYSYGLAKGLREISHKVTVIAPQVPGFESFDQKQVFPILRVKWNPPRILRVWRMYRCAFRAIKKERVDVLLATGWSPSGIVAGFLGRKFQIPYLVVALGTEISMHRPFRKLMIKTFNGSYRVIAISHFTREVLLKYGIKEEKIEVILPGIDEQQFRPLKKIPPEVEKLRGEKTLLTATRLAHKKGVDSVLKALLAVRKEIKGIVYLIIGEGEDRERLRNIVSELGLKENVRFLGKIPNEQMVYYYNLCDLFILASREEWGGKDFEGFGIVFSEASACGKPVIGGRSGGIPDAVIDGRTGILVDPDNETGIARAVIRLLKDRGLAEKMGRAGRQRVEQELNWSAVAWKVTRLMNNPG